MKLKEILKVEKKEYDVRNGDRLAGIVLGYNQAIDEIGAMNLRVDENKLARIFHNMVMREFLLADLDPGLMKKHLCANLIDCQYAFADEIIAALPTILTIEADDKKEVV